MIKPLGAGSMWGRCKVGLRVPPLTERTSSAPPHPISGLSAPQNPLF